MKTVKLTAEQLRIFKQSQTESVELEKKAKETIEVFQANQRKVNDLISMFCATAGLNQAITKIDLDSGEAIEDGVNNPQAISAVDD